MRPATRGRPPAGEERAGQGAAGLTMHAHSEKDTPATMTPDDKSNEPAERPALPDRLCVDPASPHHVAAVFEHDIGIRFNGKERHDVEEYCLSEGWIKVPAGRTLDRKGKPVLIKLKGKVEAFYR
jgi:hypothetical protein